MEENTERSFKPLRNQLNLTELKERCTHPNFASNRLSKNKFDVDVVRCNRHLFKSPMSHQSTVGFACSKGNSSAGCTLSLNDEEQMGCLSIKNQSQLFQNFDGNILKTRNGIKNELNAFAINTRCIAALDCHRYSNCSLKHAAGECKENLDFCSSFQPKTVPSLIDTSPILKLSVSSDGKDIERTRTTELTSSLSRAGILETSIENTELHRNTSAHNGSCSESVVNQRQQYNFKNWLKKCN